MSENARPMTLGERRVCLTFNPGNNDLAQQVKVKTAELIDLCETGLQAAAYKQVGQEEVRLWRLAQSHYENAAMWAVKAATS